MNKYLSIILIAIAVLFNSCSNGQNNSTDKEKLSVEEFANKLNDSHDAQILDVRTKEEFENGHLGNALNYDWNGSDFEKEISTLDKSKPVFVYCLSGGRSNAAANKMRAEGFKEVYEMSGGMMKWRAANLPQTTDQIILSKGLTKIQFDALLNSKKLVLIDFYADWCAPCKKMKPYLDEISREMSDKVIVIRINTDENQALSKELKIDTLPVLQLYNNKVLTWGKTGFIEKEDIVKQLK